MMDLPATIQQCSNGVHPETVTAIIRHESGGNPIAMNIEGETVIPANLAEALRIQAAARAAGKSFDTGLMQINSQWIGQLGIAPSSLFDPCTNVRIGTTILRHYYAMTWADYGNVRDALIGAIAAYNTGNPAKGYGYVQKVVLQAGKALPDRPGTYIGGKARKVAVTPRNAPTGFPMQTKTAAPEAGTSPPAEASTEARTAGR